MKTNRFCAIVIALSSMLALTPVGLPQDSPPGVFRMNVAIVPLESVVLDINGRPITTLKREDFAVFEDGEEQPIRSFSSVEAPYSIILLFQNTPTIYSLRLFMADASNTFLKALRQQDRISIYIMELTTKKALDWRNAQNGKIQEVKVGPPIGKLSLYESIGQVFDKLSDVKGRKGIIVMTDGEDEQLFQDVLLKGRVPPASEDKRFQKVLQKVRGRGIPLYFVAINTDRNMLVEPGVLAPPPFGVAPEINPENMVPYLFLKNIFPKSPRFRQIKDPSPTIAGDFLVECRSRMETLAEDSGGRIYFPHGLEEALPLYEEIARELGTSYSFGYAPHSSEPGTTHRIEVRVADPSLRVIQSRQSYTTR